MEACELLAIEHRLDRIEADLASELPPHLRAFARAHAHGVPAPPAPDVLHRAATLATARAALVHPVLADRGLALLRLAAPIAIESDPAVRAARLAPASWSALAALAIARDAAATARFDRRAIEVMHRLHGSALDLASAACDAPIAEVLAPSAADGARGVGGATDVSSMASTMASGDRGVPGGREGATQAPSETSGSATDRRSRSAAGLPAAVAGWFESDGVVVDDAAIARRWNALRARHGVDGAVRFERAARARPRSFVVEPGREVVVVVPASIAAPVDRFTVLHELGHAVVALALPVGIPRVLDEAIAAYVARAMEHEVDEWYSILASAARVRRCALARALDQIERALPAVPAPDARPAEQPPSALWHDPGAQAAYVAAESIADALERILGPSPAPGALAAEARVVCDAIDRVGSVGLAV
jgi:hypothetical protein